MREVVIWVRFTRYCLGNCKNPSGGLELPRTPDGRVMFMPSWHRMNVTLAAKLYGRHQGLVTRILWNPAVDGEPLPGAARWYRRYKDRTAAGVARFVVHEAISPGQVVGIRCTVPDQIMDEDLKQLMNIAGYRKGLSPYRPGEYGQFLVVRIGKPGKESKASRPNKKPPERHSEGSSEGPDRAWSNSDRVV